NCFYAMKHKKMNLRRLIKRFLFIFHVLMIYLFYYMIRINMLPPGKSLSPEQICPFLIELLFTIIRDSLPVERKFSDFFSKSHTCSHVCNPLQHVESLLQILYAIFF
ncbi:hypothetical protein ACJX0J_018496, partial [Zea mays]